VSWKFILQPVYQTTLFFSWHRYGQLSGVVEPIAGLLGTIAVVVSAYHMVLDSEVSITFPCNVAAIQIKGTVIQCRPVRTPRCVLTAK